MKISTNIPRVLKHANTALWVTVFYAIIWGLVFGLCFLIDKGVHDHTTAQILKYVKYAGYPLLGIGYVIAGIFALGLYVVSHLILGAIWLIKATFPYCLYFPGIPLAIYCLYRLVRHLANAPGPSEAEIAAEQRHAESMRVVRGAMMLRTLSDMNKK